MKTPVLVSWIAVNNDPYERERGSNEFRLVNGDPVPGPTVTVLCDQASPFSGKIKDVVLFHREFTDNNVRERRAVEETVQELRKRISGINIHIESWSGDDPTDHLSIFEFLRIKIPEIRKHFSARQLIIHISPGTPSMQTIWVLMGEAGFIDPPFLLIKSYRKADRRGRSAVQPVDIGLETFYKAFKASRPMQTGSEDQDIVLDPGKFRSSAMRELFSRARRFAHLNVPVIILGERGTGKTTIGSWIRLNSPFRRKELDSCWPTVACGQYNPETMRSELFGYKKGAFTGANTDKAGLLAAADRDTLFLDEVGDVSRDLQRLLIKALEEKQYYPLGDDRPKKSDFRLLTATNLKNDELRKRLDPDFLDRVSVFSITVPPIRDIREELPWLWENVFLQAAQRTSVSKKASQLGSAHHKRIIKELGDHPLPGNLRDLLKVAYRILSARSDPSEPLGPGDAVEFGLQGLYEGVDLDKEDDEISRVIARLFTDNMPMDHIVQKMGQINTKTVDSEFKFYMATELRRIAKKRNVSAEELCDVSERTLRSWSDGKKNIAE